MIRNETEYRESVERLRAEQARLELQRCELEKLGLKPDEVQRAMAPLESFHLDLQEEVEGYDRLKRGEFDVLKNLAGLGQLLISLRIARGLTQRGLAGKLGVHESQVSRDECNEYHGITLDRAAKILEALGAQLTTTVELPEPSPLDGPIGQASG